MEILLYIQGISNPKFEMVRLKWKASAHTNGRYLDVQHAELCLPCPASLSDLSIPAWEIPWTEEPGGLQSVGSQKSQTQFSN